MSGSETHRVHWRSSRPAAVRSGSASCRTGSALRSSRICSVSYSERRHTTRNLVVLRWSDRLQQCCDVPKELHCARGGCLMQKRVRPDQPGADVVQVICCGVAEAGKTTL